tara:strand:+ start:1579 stop:1749 length:171 start_codon:yes stop_codon:yes gene_type:complete
MPEYKIYPHSSPEFKMVQKPDGTIEMQVRYINSMQGYIGKWMPVKTENANTSTSEA